MTTHGQNDTRRTDALSETREIARTHAMGGRALTILYGKLIHWAADGVVDSSSRGTKGSKTSDAKEFYDEYAAAYVKKSAAGQDADSIKVQVSKMNSLIKLGEMTTIGDPKVQLDRFAQEYKRQAELDKKAVRPETAAMLAWAKAQLDQHAQPLSDEAIAECCAKHVKDDQTVEEYVEAVRKRLEKVINGEAGNGLKTTDDRVIAAHESLRSFITTLVVQREQQELLAKAAELGLVVVQEAAE